jgi:hypothetical protein
MFGEMRLPRKRTRWILLLLFVGVCYCGAYLWLRHTHYFIHRAGNYADPPTNHYIQVGQGPDGPQVFGAVMFGLAAGDQKPTEAELDHALAAAVEQNHKEQVFRERLLSAFFPLRFTEETIWKIINPNPLSRN